MKKVTGTMMTITKCGNFLKGNDMKISDKLTKVSDSFTINMYDNGFMVEVNGRHSDGDWKTAKIMCTNLEQLIECVSEATTMERDS
jgi:hypothetical protein